MIKDKYSSNKTLISFEVFPPKAEEDFETLYTTLKELSKHNPDFISVTHGAGGSTNKKTSTIASYIQNECNTDALAHITSISLDDSKLSELIDEYKSCGISNILALRGDRPKNMSDSEYNNRTFRYASDFIPHIQAISDFCIGAACYPEGHCEANSLDEDIFNLKHKISTGVDFLISQLFFSNDAFYYFLDKIRNAGITTPVSCGIMPITSTKMVNNTINLSGAKIPDKLASIINKYSNNPNDFKKACLLFAVEQIQDLKKHQVDGIHLYTLNKLDVSEYMYSNVL